MKPRQPLNINLIKKLASFGFTLSQVSQYHCVNPSTIQRFVKKATGLNYDDFKENEKNNLKAVLIGKAVTEALERDNTPMLKFCLKNLADWKDQFLIGNDTSFGDDRSYKIEFNEVPTIETEAKVVDEN